MVKSTGSSPKSTGLSDVVEQLKANNRLVDQQNTSIQSLLDEARDARIQEKKALVAENRQQALEKKSRLERMKENRVKPKGITGNFVRGAIGGTAYTGLRNMTDGMFGGAGFGLGAAAGGLARLAGKGLMFVTAASALNKVAQGALDRVFDDIKPEDIGFKDEEQARKRITGGLNVALGAKFLGFRGRTSLLLGIGTAFGDQITSWIADKMDTDNISMPGWVAKTFGLNPDEMQLNLKDPKTSAAIGAAISLIAGQIAIEASKWATKTSYRKIKNAILPTDQEKLTNRTFNPNAKSPVITANVPKLKSSPTSAADEALEFADNVEDVIVKPNAPKLLGPDGNPVRPSLSPNAPKKLNALTKADFEASKAKQDFKKRVLKAEARYKSKTALNKTMMKNITKAFQNPALRKTIGVGGKVVGPLSFGLSGYMGIKDEERKDAGQTGLQRFAGGIAQDVGSFADIVVNSFTSYPNRLTNLLLEKAGFDVRLKDGVLEGGASGEIFGKTIRKGSFFLFKEMNELNANMKSSENLIRDLGYGGYFNSSQTPPPVIIDNSSSNQSVSTNNFSSNSEIINKDPYAYGYLGAMQ